MPGSSHGDGRIIAIGDIHGCSTALKTILDAIDPQPSDTLITMGDYVDRGPDSRGVLEQLLPLARRCQLIPLLGNHEILLLQSLGDNYTFDFWQHCGGDTTLASYGGSVDNIPPEHLAFIRELRPFHETDQYLFVHANYDPDKPLGETQEILLYWEHVSARLPKAHYSGKTVIVGHTPQATGQILDLGFLICIDTYCFGGGWLTGLDLSSGRLWQGNDRGELREGTRQ